MWDYIGIRGGTEGDILLKGSVKRGKGGGNKEEERKGDKDSGR